MTEEKKKVLEKAYENLMQAVCPEDVFGEIIETSVDKAKDKLKKIYHELSRTVHPDCYDNDHNLKEMAKEAFQILGDLYQQAQKRIEDKSYGLRLENQEVASDFLIKTLKREYVIQANLAEGDLAVLYRGSVCGVTGLEGQVVIKITISSDDNDLAFNEIKVLKIFQSQPSQQSKHLPVLLDNFKTTEGQHALIIRYFDGYDLYSVREKYPSGLIPEHVAWILARALSALGYVHSQGIIHGNIEPAHIMIRPRDHNVMIVGWSAACVNPQLTGDGFKINNETYSPLEVAEKKSPLPSSDIYSLGKTMIYLLGGNPETKYIPLQVPLLFRQFLQAMVLDSALQRPRDAWDLYCYLNEIRTKIWGPTRFLELKM